MTSETLCLHLILLSDMYLFLRGMCFWLKSKFQKTFIILPVGFHATFCKFFVANCKVLKASVSHHHYCCNFWCNSCCSFLEAASQAISVEEIWTDMPALEVEVSASVPEYQYVMTCLTALVLLLDCHLWRKAGSKTGEINKIHSTQALNAQLCRSEVYFPYYKSVHFNFIQASVYGINF